MKKLNNNTFRVFIFVHLSKIGQVNFWLHMAQRKYPQVKDNYEYYNKLLSDRKSIFSEVLEINKFGNNANTLSHQEVVSYPNCKDMFLIVDIKVNNHNFFQFKLRYKDFIPAPFFRFDSDGETHRNKIDGIPLEEQSVDTPHFHKYNENGIEIAYKTEQLRNPEEAKALEDINLCIAHFFHESNIRVNEDSFPEVKIMSNTLGFSMTQEDPNQNVNFL